VYANQLGPVVRKAKDGERELVRIMWGTPTPPERVKSKADYGTTNIRNPHYNESQLADTHDATATLRTVLLGRDLTYRFRLLRHHPNPMLDLTSRGVNPFGKLR